MELFEEMLQQKWKEYLTSERNAVPLGDPALLIEAECYQALKKIKAIIEDDSLDDPECFEKIERIVCTLECLGSDGGSRHDFG